MVRTPKSDKQAAVFNLDQLKLGVGRLSKRIEDVRKFNPGNVHDQYNNPELDRLSASVDDALIRTFGANSIEYDRYRHAVEFDNGPHNYADQVPISEVRQSLSRSRARTIALLEQAVEGLSERIAEEVPKLELVVEPNRTNNKKVFIVHGHAGMEDTVARFLSKLGFEPIILHEQANQGRTVIEKFEAHSDVGFAIVLLTDDDVGGAKNGQHQPRARQNVVLELGYFIGKLGRKRVLALKRGEIEIPSDILGVIWADLDSAGAWRLRLAQELEAAGYPIDWNLVMKP